jgi:large conductance mechanosensitive channel
MGLFQEFKQFISRGNVIDIAIGFIIGAAFSKISASLVSDILMPPLGLVIDNVKFDQLVIPLKEFPDKPPIGIYYGKFIQTVIDFFIIAFAVFLIFKAAAYLKKKEPSKPAASSVKSDEVILLEQIRDILEKKNL